MAPPRPVRKFAAGLRAVFASTPALSTVELSADPPFESFLAKLAPVWRGCDVVLACSERIDQAVAALPRLKIVCIDDVGEFARLAKAFRRAPHQQIGIVSPELVGRLMGDQEAMRSLVRLCRQQVWLVQPAGEEMATSLRTRFHAAGFYEVAQGVEFGEDHVRLDYSSVGVQPDGEFRLISTCPSLMTDAGEYRLYTASRLPLRWPAPLPWRIVGGVSYLTADGLSTVADASTALTIHHAGIGAPGRWHGRIRGTFRWSENCDGYNAADLVACYSGPGDSHMLSVKVEPASQGHARLSLWRCVSGWEPLAGIDVEGSLVDVEGAAGYELDVWLDIGRNTLQAGLGPRALLQADDATVIRTDAYGLRLCGASIRVGNVVTDEFKRAAA